MATSSSSENGLSALIAFKFSSSWATELAPIRTEVTLSSLSSHEMAISERVWERPLAIWLRLLSFSNSSGVMFFVCREVFLLALEPEGTSPLRYREVSRPWARGEKHIIPILSSMASRRLSSSVQRSRMEYRTWLRTHGHPISSSKAFAFMASFA